MRIKNFLFHRVSEQNDKLWPPITPQKFEKTIKFLSKHYHVIALEDFLRDPMYFSSSKKRFASISFDDGYKDNILYAAPILRRYGMPASFYVITDCIDKNLPTWTFLTDYFVQNTIKEKLEFHVDFVPEDIKVINTKDPNKKKLKNFMKRIPNWQRVVLLDELFLQCKDVDLPKQEMMSWNDIRELQHNGFIIGSHSHTHPMLAVLENENDIEEELFVSREKLKKEVGIIPESISYPIGSYDERVKRIASKTGYKYGLAVDQLFWEAPFHDLYQIPRVELYNQPFWKTRMRINGIYLKAKKLLK